MEIDALVEGRISAESTHAEIMRQALDFMKSDVDGFKRPRQYFLAPIFAFLKPTALQVLRHGGDCAYRARAFIVILRRFGVHATKLALYDRRGEPVHAVVRVQTERGPFIADLLFNFLHEDEMGRPIPVDDLADAAVLRQSVERAVRRGCERAGEYPLEKYTFGDVRTINWNKSFLLRGLYGALSLIVGEQAVKNLPRPHFTEEPAIMVAILCLSGQLLCLFLLWKPLASKPQSDEPEHRKPVLASSQVEE